MLQEYDLKFSNDSNGKWHQVLDGADIYDEIVLTYPNLQERIDQWRIDNVMSPNFEDECGLPEIPGKKDSLLVLPETVTGQRGFSSIIQGVSRPFPTKPQHSHANIIFKKKTIQLQIFDYLTPDGDRVAIYFNGNLVKRNMLLRPFPGETITLTMKPSLVLGEVNHFPANTLRIFALSSNGFFPINEFRGATVGIKVKNPRAAFRGGPLLRADAVITADVRVGSIASQLNMGVGLICIGPGAPLSIEHIEHAWGFQPDSGADALFQSHGWPHILTVDRNTPADPFLNKVERRRGASTRRYQRGERFLVKRKSGEQYDEYPPATFKENRGMAHVRPIKASDNGKSGNDILRYMTGNHRNPPIHENGNQVEIVVPNFFGLVCRDAF